MSAVGVPEERSGVVATAARAAEAAAAAALSLLSARLPAKEQLAMEMRGGFKVSGGEGGLGKGGLRGKRPSPAVCPPQTPPA